MPALIPATQSDAKSGFRRPAALALVGCMGGFLSGLFGGGGVLVVPLLIGLLAMPVKLAHGTSTAAIALIALAGVAGYGMSGSVDPVVAAFLSLGGAGGAVAGTALLKRTSERRLRICFTIVLLLTGARLFLEAPQLGDAFSLTLLSAVALVGVGVLAGVIAGLLGIGGGLVAVPALTLFFGLSMLSAKGTSLLFIVPTSIAGTLSNLRSGQVDLRAAMVVGLSGMVTSMVGVGLSKFLDPKIATILFAALLVVVAGRTLATLMRSSATQE